MECVGFERPSRGMHLPRRHPLGPTRRRSRHATAASTDDKGNSSYEDDARRVTLEDLTRPGLTPWQVLGVSTVPPTDATVAEVKAAYRARMKVYHPDVYDGDGNGEEMARRIVAAYRAVVGGGASDVDVDVDVEWDGVSEVFPWWGAGYD